MKHAVTSIVHREQAGMHEACALTCGCNCRLKCIMQSEWNDNKEYIEGAEQYLIAQWRKKVKTNLLH